MDKLSSIIKDALSGPAKYYPEQGIGVGYLLPAGTVKASFIQAGSYVGPEKEYMKADQVVRTYYRDKDKVKSLVHLGFLSSVGEEPTLWAPDHTAGKCCKSKADLGSKQNIFMFTDIDEFFKKGVEEMGTTDLMVFDDKGHWLTRGEYISKEMGIPLTPPTDEVTRLL